MKKTKMRKVKAWAIVFGHMLFSTHNTKDEAEWERSTYADRKGLKIIPRTITYSPPK